MGFTWSMERPNAATRRNRLRGLVAGFPRDLRHAGPVVTTPKAPYELSLSSVQILAFCRRPAESLCVGDYSNLSIVHNYRQLSIKLAKLSGGGVRRNDPGLPLVSARPLATRRSSDFVMLQ